MLEAFVYPVSAVMKLWHWLLADVFNVAPDTAWVLSICLLVLTVRGLLVPSYWSTFKSSRKMLMMRPEQIALEERYGASLEPDDITAHEKALKELNKEYGYNPLSGCIPPLVQLPFILGLYRLLIWMSVPENGRTGSDIGLLNPDDIAGFLKASFLGVPLPAYVSMSQEQFAALGTTGDDVRAVAIPLLIFAIIFTTFNMFVSQLRSRVHMDWNERMAVRIYDLMWWLMLLIPVMLGFVGMTGLIPIALLMYWFISNLWTLCQTAIMWYLLTRKYPLEPHHLDHVEEARADAQNKEAKRSRRSRNLQALAHPSTLPEVRRTIKAEKQAEKQALKDKKAEKKNLKKEKSKVRSDMRKAEMEERKKARDEAKTRSNSQPEEPTASDAPDPDQ